MSTVTAARALTLLVLLLLAACGVPKGAGGDDANREHEDTIDVVLAIDGSRSFQVERDALIAVGVGLLVEELEASRLRYRIGVVGHTPANPDLERDLDAPGWEHLPGTAAWVDSDELDVGSIERAVVLAVESIDERISEGRGGSYERVVFTAVDALAGDSTGFLRPGARLIVIAATDVDDGLDHYTSTQEPSHCGGFHAPTEPLVLADKLTAAHGAPAKIALVLVHGVMERPHTLAAECGERILCERDLASPFPGPAPVMAAPRIAEFAELMTARGARLSTIDLCDAFDVEGFDLPEAIAAAVRDAL